MERHRPYDIITFDCYGTLIDWNAGISGALQSAAREDGVELSRDEILVAYHGTEPAIQAGAYRAYKDVLATVALACAKRLGWRLDPERAALLAASVGDWTPFPDTNRALSDLGAAGYQLGILSNIDDDLLAMTRRHFPADFEIVVTAEQVSSYKPAAAHFEEARRRIGDRRWLHAAQSYFHDIAPACAAGIPAVWVNRLSESPPGNAQPEGVVKDVAGLVQWLARQA